MVKNCAKLVGAQSLPRAWRSVLHENLAMEQVKKICDAFSKAPQRGQRPSEGPNRDAIYMPEGKISRANCQENTLIFNGSLASQISLYMGKVAPCDRCEYIELTEYFPEGSRAQEISSCSWLSDVEVRIRFSSWHCAAPTAFSDLRRVMLSVIAEATEIDWLSQMLNNRGNLWQSGPSPCHQSSQNRVRIPLRILCLAPALKRCFIL